MSRHGKYIGRCHALMALLAIILFAATPSRDVAAQAAPAAAPPHAVMQRLVRVPQPEAISMAVSDAHRVLVAGLGNTAKDAIVVYKLAADGTLTADAPQLLNIPRPAALAAAVIQPIDMVLHPTLPLLYVWVDIAGFANGTPEYTLATEQLNHLVIYKIANGALEQVAAVAAGASFNAGQRFSPIAISPDGTRLFASNTTDGNGGMGYFDLDAEGAVVPIAIPVKGSLDGYGLEEFQMETRPRTISVRAFRDYPTAVGMACFSRDFACFTTGSSLTVWDTTNRLAPLGVTYMRNAAAHMFLAAHPTKSVLYTMPQNANGVAQRIAHAQGFPSQLPAEVATPVATASPVVIGGSRPAMVSASATKLLVFPLKANGDFDGECLQYDLPADRVQAVAVSQKAQRVYAAVKPEVKPE
jgi:hypothetical protein